MESRREASPDSAADWAALSEPFAVAVREGEEMLLAEVRGSLDVENAPALSEKLRPLCDPETVLVVDLSRAEYVDSSGLKALLALRDRLDGTGGELFLVVPPRSRMERLLKLLRIQDQFLLLDSVPS
jgi:anti-sigma B factor antagonist